MSNSDADRLPVELSHISKRFGATQALDDVSVTIRPGQVHSIVGENGAGKSTLGKIIAGVYSPDDGDLLIDGDPVRHWNPGTAQTAGIAMIAQELALVPDLTVAENVYLGAERHRLGFLKRGLNERFAALDAEVGFGLNPRALVRDLRIADQQKTEILRSLARNANVIVMDEPTSSLTAHEMGQLETLMRSLSERGCSIIYVSHFLDSVLRVSDTVTVMRDGRHIMTVPAEDVGKRDLVTAMLGRELDQAFPDRTEAPEPGDVPLLKVSNLATDTGVKDMSFEVHRGEIVGLLGLVGSGRSECLRALIGVDAITGGTVEVKGFDRTGAPPHRMISEGVFLVPEDRHKDGLVLERSVRENIALSSLAARATSGIVRTSAEIGTARELADSLEIRPLDIERPVGQFSGGNQQKALLAKALAAKPDLVILDEPTRGVDVGAKRTIYDLISRLAADGYGVLLISSEHEEIMELAHRAYLVAGGRTIDHIEPSESTMENVLFRLFHVASGEEPAA
ncbi:sugar ABC transporter ATP-binding protein [Brevibacterium sp.]|uniref:sugar ABC transporter ATP-binding protein n=1 Tax=Brevibacterium sp. TaxID=1701 RepID=UPI00281149C2|nr:sugar ABC transporter ATP-binding protein [Brevibacterium sp.]